MIETLYAGLNDADIQDLDRILKLCRQTLPICNLL